MTDGRIDWPDGFDRTAPDDREPNRNFQATLAQTTEDLETELRRMDLDERDWRAEFGNTHSKSNGLPLHNANPDHPGFVLYWTHEGADYAVACDAYSRLRDNCREVYLWLHETRLRADRAVVTGSSEFAAARLPPGDAETESAVVAGPVGDGRVHHEVLEVARDASDAVVESVARRKMATHHPDGSDPDTEEFKRVKRAKEAMLNDE